MSLDQTAEIVKRQTATLDAFLGGKLSVLQPKTGFRAGLDSVLLGASVAKGTTSLLDLGSGVGVAAFVALAHNDVCVATLVENDGEVSKLAAQNIVHNKFAERVTQIALDVTAAGKTRTDAGLKSDHYQSVVCNPPFFDATAGTKSPQAHRAAARHMEPGLLDRWVRAAAASAAPGAEAIFLHNAANLPELLQAFSNRFGAITVLPIVSRDGEDASRVLVRGKKGSRAPMNLKSPLVIHDPTGHEFREKTGEIFRGTARLNW